jgi:iron complex outermembrane recepter protein
MTRSHLWVLLTGTLTLGYTGSIGAVEKDTSAGVLEELLVTARKREESLQDVAVGVSLLTGKALAEAQLRNAADLATLIPTLNVQASSGPATQSFNIRGIGTQSFSKGVEPSVSTMLDGVVMGRSGMAFVDLVDIERVEVLRGPQGTLYGKNASGGVIHIITQDPTEELHGTVSATAIEEDEYRLDGTISGPITDSLRFRLTGSVVDDDGYVTNYYNGNTVNDSEEYNIRGKLLWQPDDALELIWSSDYSEVDCRCTALSLRSIMESPVQEAMIAEQLPVVPSNTNQDVNNDQETFSDRDASGHSLTLNWMLDKLTVTSISAYREWNSEGAVDFDNRPSNPFELEFPRPFQTEQEQWSQEFRFTSADHDWGNYVFGLYYFQQDIDDGNTIDTTFLAPVFEPVSRASDTSVKSKNAAAFGELSYILTEGWQLTVGARYTYDELEYDTVIAGAHPIVFPDEGSASGNHDEDDISPRLALQWDASDTMMAYASYTAGYKGPGFDTGLAAGGALVEPETSDAYELGLKSTWFDNRLALNIAVFYAEYQDFQAESFEDLNPNDALPGSFIQVNAGEVTTQGVEIDFLASPLDNWSLRGGLAYTDAEIDDYPRGNCSSGQKYRGECPLGYQDLSGGTLSHTPEWKLTLGTDYTIDLESIEAKLVFGGDLRYQDEVLFNLSQDEFSREDSYTIVDLRASLAGTENGYKVMVFVKNVFDKHYASLIYAQANELLPHSYIHYVPKYANRQWGLELRYDY